MIPSLSSSVSALSDTSESVSTDSWHLTGMRRRHQPPHHHHRQYQHYCRTVRISVYSFSSIKERHLLWQHHHRHHRYQHYYRSRPISVYSFSSIEGNASENPRPHHHRHPDRRHLPTIIVVSTWSEFSTVGNCPRPLEAAEGKTSNVVHW